MNLLREVVRNRNVDAPAVLEVQREMVDDNKNLDETAAGRQFEAELIRQRKKHEEQIRQIQEETRMLLEVQDLRSAEALKAEQRKFERRISQSFDDQAKLKSSLQDIVVRQEEDLKRMQAQVDRDRATYEGKIERLERAQSELSRMDPGSASSQALTKEVALEQEQVVELAKDIAAQDESIRRKAKRESSVGVLAEVAKKKAQTDIARRVLHQGRRIHEEESEGYSSDRSWRRQVGDYSRESQPVLSESLSSDTGSPGTSSSAVEMRPQRFVLHMAQQPHHQDNMSLWKIRMALVLAKPDLTRSITIHSTLIVESNLINLIRRPFVLAECHPTYIRDPRSPAFHFMLTISICICCSSRSVPLSVAFDDLS